MSSPLTEDLRNGDLLTLSRTLEDISSRAADVVVPGKSLTFMNGLAVVNGVEPILSQSGVTEVNGRYRPTLVGQEGLATKLDIPLSYMRRLSLPEPPPGMEVGRIDIIVRLKARQD